MLDIGKAVNYILTNSTAVTTLIDPNKIYPLIVPDDMTQVTFPVLVYTRSTVTTERSTNCQFREVDVTILIHAESYEESVNIAQAVTDAMEETNGVIEGITIDSIMLTSAGESFDSPAFTQQLFFNIQ
jgi:hypothetical protein